MSDLPQSLKGEYEAQSSDRSPYLDRARECSKYTLPWLIPPSGSTGGRSTRKRYSDFGARCVNSLGSKLLLTVLPARNPFFRYLIEDEALRRMGGAEDMRSEVEQALSGYEQVIQNDIDTTQTRTPVGVGINHLLVGGNVLLHAKQNGGVKVIPLSNYVCQRDGDGSPMRTVAMESVSPLSLPDSIREKVRDRIKARTQGHGAHIRTVELYTGIFKTDNGWTVWQEVEGIKVPQSHGTYPEDACPWLALRLIPIDGENYGRGMVESFLGYFISLEGLTASLVKGTAAASKLIYLVRPNGNVKAKQLTSSETGDAIPGAEGDVVVLQTDKRADMATGRQMIEDLKSELSYAFALNQSIQRNAERVTAEEIRYMAMDLDATLGGIYSNISMEFQLPWLRVRERQLSKDKRLPSLPKGMVRPSIITGLEALGRGADLENLKALVSDVVDMGGPQALSKYMNFQDLLTRLTTARSVKPKGLIKTAEEVAAAEQQEQMQMMVDKLGPNAVNQIGGMAQKQLETQGTPQ